MSTDGLFSGPTSHYIRSKRRQHWQSNRTIRRLAAKAGRIAGMAMACPGRDTAKAVRPRGERVRHPGRDVGAASPSRPIAWPRPPFGL